MAGTKKSPYKKGGQNRYGPARSKRNQRLEQSEDASEPPTSALHTLSLADVARNTERHRDGQRQGPRQGTKLQFVSGGILSSDLLEPLESSRPLPRAAGERDRDREDEEPRKPPSLSSVPDRANGRVCRTPRANATDTDDNSSDDVVLFLGRAAAAPAPSKQSQRIDAKLGHESGPRTQHQKRKIPRTPELDTTEAWPQERTSDVQPHSKADHVRHPTATKEAPRSETFAILPSNSYPSADDAALEDYISNVAAHASDNEIDDLEPSHIVASKRAVNSWSQSSHAPQQGARAETASVGSADTLDDITRDLQTVLDGMDDENIWTGYEDSSALPEELVQHRRLSRPTDSVVRFTYSSKEDTGTASEMSAGVLQMSRSSVLEASTAFADTDRLRRSVKNDAGFSHPETNLQLSDTDLERNLVESWKADRAKKKLHRKEREEARVKGVLKKRGGSVAEKLHQDIDWENIKARILTFLVSGDESLILPPMDKTRRRIIHELANAFNLRSKSAGSGERRYPVLHRTVRTLHVTESLYAEVEARLARRFRTGAGKPGTDRSKTSFAAASYRDGDVVGAQAPEIGSENRGRTMLEKMGWSSGTALGAANNKGILQPVAHTVKNTRHGLG